MQYHIDYHQYHIGCTNLPFQIRFNKIEMKEQSKKVLKVQQLHQTSKSALNVSYQQSNPLILNKPNEDSDSDQASILSLFRFATKFDMLLLVFGTICAAAMGASQPVMIIFIGDITNIFVSLTDLEQKAKEIFVKIAIVGVVAFLSGWGMYASWMIVGEKQHIQCRKQYLKSLLRQQIGWFDITNQSQLSTRFAVDCFAYKGAISENLSTFIMTISLFVAGFSIAFSYGWLMTLVIIGCLPFIVIGGVLFSKANSQREQAQEKKYTEAGGRVQQTIFSIKTIKNLNGESYQADKYSQILGNIIQSSTKFALFVGLGLGSLFFFILCSYSFGFWFGSHCVEGSKICPADLNGGSTYQPGDVLVIFFSVLMGGFNLSQLTPAFKKITQGRVAAKRIFQIIDREPLVKSIYEAYVPQQFKGVFQFHKVSFSYPKDKSTKILNNLNLKIDVNSSAFVGTSGCGKSTIFQLIMRFYDPDEGSVTLDGVNLKQLDLTWLRNQIGYVGQEPILFAATIKENLLFGNDKATDDELNDALKRAQAQDFVYRLDNGLETFVGAGGGRLSGGQKQRLAIARALLKNPKLLLLDEATSALDRKNERLIQKTLNQISKDRITFTIAHKIKTIVNVDKIFVIYEGAVLEAGRFEALQRFKNVSLEEEEDIQQNMETQQNIEEGIIKDTDITGAQNLQKQKRERQLELEALVKAYEEQGIYGRLFSYVGSFKLLFFIGILVSIGNGLIFPFFSIILTKMLVSLIKMVVLPVQARDDANQYALIVFLIGIAAFFFSVFQQTIFIRIGDEMTRKIREAAYSKILKMPVAWFDLPQNSSGAVSMKLASQCQIIKNLITNLYPNLIQVITTLAAGVIIAYIYEWRISLVASGVLPVILLAGVLQIKISEGFGDKTDRIYEQASSLITQSINYIRTVAAFCQEKTIHRKHDAFLQKPLSVGVKKGVLSGLFFGLTQGVMFTLLGMLLYVGIIFLVRNNLYFEDMFTALYAVGICGIVAGNNSHHLPDLYGSKKAAASIFQLLESEDQDEMQIRTKSKKLTTPIQGNFQFKDVVFKYLSQDTYLLKEINLKIKKGQKVGFVGESGCGKSTIFQLIQRFYDPERGQILIDDVDIKQYDIHHLRRSFGVVSQQPTLFNDSIRQNIKYNKFDATEEEIREAARQSNFDPEAGTSKQIGLTNNESRVLIQQGESGQTSAKHLKQIQENELEAKNTDNTGFNKKVGLKGSHLSGGQKQRVAIARVTLRKPQILLLDQATSALDSTNEKIVQQTLDSMMAGKTSLQITHRMDIIRNSDQIFVFDEGQIVEHGTFESLMEQQGFFYNLERGGNQDEKARLRKTRAKRHSALVKDRFVVSAWKLL